MLNLRRRRGDVPTAADRRAGRGSVQVKYKSNDYVQN
nr:MAG TPA: hypothetical protein [Caudoviricetes sp.]